MRRHAPIFARALPVRALVLGGVLLFSAHSGVAQNTPREDAPRENAPRENAPREEAPRPNRPNAAERGDESRKREEARAERVAILAARRAAFEKRVREMLAKAGFPEAATQDAIIAYMAGEEQAKNSMRNAARRLVFAVHRDVPPERLVELIGAFKKAREDNELRAKTALAELDEKIRFSTNPRLEAVLLISGILGGEGLRLEIIGGRNTAPRENPQRPRNDRERDREQRENDEAPRENADGEAGDLKDSQKKEAPPAQP